ncbi:NUDIX hydrolase [Nonomuraea turcica]|uniref:NUDIX hydrolase n=1 Tax=Nonomuraea sp. G32 TaxID=3067274 RepID=UPI00273C236E|nr:NUDIX hydrolase [Nonomuraea sp. G32]MDP4510354.1 NUDIX hydrolase [Nonomuraea sp. G32]
MSTIANPAPFSRLKIRTGALVFCDNDVALIRRDRATSTHYTPPGGNVEPGEPLPAALRRELAEELHLDLRQASAPQLVWTVDQRISRPGPTPPPRKLHMIYRLHITAQVRATLADREYDELPNGSHELGIIEWIDYRKTEHSLRVARCCGNRFLASPQLKGCEHDPIERDGCGASGSASRGRGNSSGVVRA